MHVLLIVLAFIGLVAVTAFRDWCIRGGFDSWRRRRQGLPEISAQARRVTVRRRLAHVWWICLLAGAVLAIVTIENGSGFRVGSFGNLAVVLLVAGAAGAVVVLQGRSSQGA